MVRKNRGYKATDKVYDKAKKRADRNGTPLATLIEQFIEDYGAGWVVFVSKEGNELAYGYKDHPYPRT